MATQLDDAKIRVILDLSGARGGDKGSPEGGGGDGDGRGGQSPEAPPIPGTPTPEETERRRERKRPRTTPGAAVPGLGPGSGDDGGGGPRIPGIAPRGGRSVVNYMRNRRRGPAGLGVAAGGLRAMGGAAGGALGATAAVVAGGIAVEEFVRVHGPWVSAVLEEIVRAHLPRVPGAADASLGIADAGQVASNFLNRGVQALPATIRAAERTMELERARALLGGDVSEFQVAMTMGQEWEIAYQQDLAGSVFDRVAKRKIGATIGRVLAERTRHNMGR